MRPLSLTNLPPFEGDVGDRRGRIADGGDHQRRGHRHRSRRCREPRPFRRARCVRRRCARPCRRLRSRTGLAKKSKTMRFGLSCGRSAKPRSRVTDLRKPRLERLVRLDRREVGRIDDRHRGFEMAELAKLLGGHRDLVRAAAAEDGDRSGSPIRRARRARGRRCPSLRIRAASSTGCARNRARHCHCRQRPRSRRRGTGRGRRIRDGRCTSRRTPPSRRRRAGLRPALRACGRAERRWRGSPHRRGRAARRPRRRSRPSHCR